LIDISIESPFMSVTEAEIETQPGDWLRAWDVAKANQHLLPQPGERVAAVGCGTSWFMASAYAAAREAAGVGETDAFAASEYPHGRSYDRIVAISRSGTTTEVVRLLGDLPTGRASTVITAVPGSPVTAVAESTVVLDYADEESVVQTRFATTALTLLLAALGVSPEAESDAAALALQAPLPERLTEYRRIVFLGSGWTIGLAAEAALKIREAAGAWTESYPAMEYRHGPITAASGATLVWPIGEVDPTVLEAAVAAGSTIAPIVERPLASLVMAQRAAVALARARGLDPDRPLNLTRSVVLP
jgi:fructoselysine-6-P-deglycase FrlB-like protein